MKPIKAVVVVAKPKPAPMAIKKTPARDGLAKYAQSKRFIGA